MSPTKSGLKFRAGAGDDNDEGPEGEVGKINNKFVSCNVNYYLYDINFIKFNMNNLCLGRYRKECIRFDFFN